MNIEPQSENLKRKYTKNRLKNAPARMTTKNEDDVVMLLTYQTIQNNNAKIGSLSHRKKSTKLRRRVIRSVVFSLSS